MVFGTSHTLCDITAENLNVHINDVAIELVDEFKYLGVYLDMRLTFSKHVEYITKKCMGKLRMLGKTRKFVN